MWGLRADRVFDGHRLLERPHLLIDGGRIAAARACGVGDRKGRLAAGFDADIVSVAGDPFREAGALTSVTAVWRAGTRVR